MSIEGNTPARTEEGKSHKIGEQKSHMLIQGEHLSNPKKFS
jgi:hypothetical protein